MRARILEELRALEARHDVRILFAIESGSRAWGFPSPDSDYDARFVYARRPDWYLSLEPGRDVIELPIDGELDINGWDLKKALNLLLKPNPVLLEWMLSPIRYVWHETACGPIREFADRIAHGPACHHHYLHLGESSWNRHIADRGEVNLKKYFYVVRPVAALRWVRMYPDRIPPMNFQQMLEGLDLSSGLVNALAELLEAKSRSKEIGLARRVTVIDDFIESELALARATQPVPTKRDPDVRSAADHLFRDCLKTVFP